MPDSTPSLPNHHALATATCVPCEGNVRKLTQQQATAMVRVTPDWVLILIVFCYPVATSESRKRENTKNDSMTDLPRHRILSLLSECTGDEIWNTQHCRDRRLPEIWIKELSDAFESSFDCDRQTIYTDAGATNQYHGIRDVDLAIRLAESLGIRIDSNALARFSRARLVQAIKDAVMNGDDQL